MIEALKKTRDYFVRERGKVYKKILENRYAFKGEVFISNLDILFDEYDIVAQIIEQKIQELESRQNEFDLKCAQQAIKLGPARRGHVDRGRGARLQEHLEARQPVREDDQVHGLHGAEDPE